MNTYVIIDFKGVDTMNNKHTSAEKQDAISRHQDGQSVTQISQKTGISKSTIYNWLKEESRSQDNPKEFTLKNFRILEKRSSV